MGFWDVLGPIILYLYVISNKEPPNPILIIIRSHPNPILIIIRSPQNPILIVEAPLVVTRGRPGLRSTKLLRKLKTHGTLRASEALL